MCDIRVKLVWYSVNIHYLNFQYNVLWSIPAEDYKFDEWVKFKWEVIWSVYNDNGENCKCMCQNSVKI